MAAVFDAYSFLSKLVRKARTSIVLIDNYVDDSVLTMLLKRVGFGAGGRGNAKIPRSKDRHLSALGDIRFQHVTQ